MPVFPNMQKADFLIMWLRSVVFIILKPLLALICGETRLSLNPLNPKRDI